MNPMSTMLFYQNPVLLNRETHRQLRLKAPTDGHRFAADTNSIPLTSPEFGVACLEYVIVFVAGTEGPGMPTVMTGLRNEENLFVDAAGRWDASYIPSFVRRYPFLLQEQNEEGSSLVLLDEGFPGFNTEEGEPLFAEDGKPAPFLEKTLSFLEDTTMHVSATIGFMERLVKFELLTPNEIEVVTRNGQKVTMGGFSIVDEQRLAKLSDAQLVELARNGDLGWIYAHLISMNNMGKLSRMLEDRIALETSE